MPRVETKTANRGATKEKTCSAPVCRATNGEGEGDPTIRPGQKYHTWSFRYGGTYYQHAACGYPRPSRLTQSKMATVLAAIEEAEDSISAIDDVDALPSPEDVLGPVAEAAREVAEEYREAAEAMGGAGESNNERADELDSFADELESFSCSEGEWEAESIEDPDPKRQAELEAAEEERRENYLENFKSELSDAINNAPSF